MNNTNFDLYIRQCCSRLGLTLTQAAMQSDMSRNNLYKLMAGNAENARLSTLVKLANTLQTNPHTLLKQMFEQSEFPAPSSISSHTHDASGFIADISIPDNSMVKRGQRFTKIWKIQNTGHVIWDKRFLICVDEHIEVASHTDRFNSPISQRGLIPSEKRIAIDKLSPGETTEISVEFTSPNIPGSCISYWKMCDANNNLFFPELEGLSCQVQVLYY